MSIAESSSNDVVMTKLHQRLSDAVSQAAFDLEYTRVRGDGSRKRVSKRGLTGSELAEACGVEDYGTVDFRIYVNVSETLISQLCDELRSVLQSFIDPTSDCLGHAFPIDQYDGSERVIGRPDGFTDFEYRSPAAALAKGLVRAAAIIGTNSALQLLADWCGGAQIRLRTSTFLNGLPLRGQLSARGDIEIRPLPLTTTDLPRLPIHDSLVGQNYLGLTVLTLMRSASPVLFRPDINGAKPSVISRTISDVNIGVVCDALSLQANRYVSPSFAWTEQVEAAPFSMNERRGAIFGTVKAANWKSLTLDGATGSVTIERPDNEALVSLDGGELMQTIEALQRAHKKVRIAVERWRGSKRPGARWEDRFIDLRIALETLYLKDFVNENSGEMRFRLSLFGAWHLGSTPAERRDIRKCLRDAYDKASIAVHSGEAPQNAEAVAVLGKAQEMCRRGILKLLTEGPPEDWGDLILGDSVS